MKKVSLLLCAAVIIFTLFGLLMVYDSSSFSAFRDFSDKYHYIKDQFQWSLLGALGFMFFYFFDYHKLYNLSLPLLIAALILLAVVFVPGIGVYVLGAHRWINTGLFIIQPAEFVKLVIAIYLAAWFSQKEKGRFLAFCLLLGAILGLVLLEPDMGTALIILSEALIVYFLSGGIIAHFLLLIPVVFASLFALVKLEPYRAARLSAFFHPSQTVNNSSYHVKQILIAFGMGGITGVGLGNSLQKYAYLPETSTDSIFAIIGEEFGFIGSVALIVLFVVFAWCGFFIAKMAKDHFGKLLASGIITFLATQAVLNLGAQTALIPLTGVPLPFISYGGSSLVVDLCSVGIVLNIAKQSRV